MALSRWTGRPRWRPCGHLDLPPAVPGGARMRISSGGAADRRSGSPCTPTRLSSGGRVAGAGRDAPVSGHDAWPHLHCCGRGASAPQAPPTLGARTPPLRTALFRERGQLGRQDAASRASPATPPQAPPSPGAALPGAPAPLLCASSRNLRSAVDPLRHRVRPQGPQGGHPSRSKAHPLHREAHGVEGGPSPKLRSDRRPVPDLIRLCLG